MLRRLSALSGRIARLACVVVCLLCASSAAAQTRHRFRARFEPTSLQLQQPGAVQLDVQVGAIYGDGQDGSRLVSPDFEVDVGVLPWLELDIDGGFTVIHVNENPPARGTYGEPLWTSAKIGLYDHDDSQTGRNVGVGLQVGPRLPSLRTAPGVGFAGLLLVGGGTRRVHVGVNVGTVLDRGQSPGMVYGVDLAVALCERATWSLIAELGGGHYFGSALPNQLIGTLGVGFQPSEAIGLSLIGLGGFLRGNDRLGVLAGLSTSFGRRTPRAAPVVTPVAP